MIGLFFWKGYHILYINFRFCYAKITPIKGTYKSIIFSLFLTKLDTKI